MFTWVKKLFGGEKPVTLQDKYVTDGHSKVQTASEPASAAVAVKTETKQSNISKSTKAQIDAIAKAAAPKKAVINAAKHTKASLGKLTKADIEKIAKTEFGVDLDRRKTKNDMIKDFLVEQKK